MTWINLGPIIILNQEFFKFAEVKGSKRGWYRLLLKVVQSSYISGKFYQRPSVICIRLSLSFTFYTLSSLVQGNLQWRFCLFFSLRLILNDSLTFYTQSSLVQGQKPQNFIKPTFSVYSAYSASYCLFSAYLLLTTIPVSLCIFSTGSGSVWC